MRKILFALSGLSLLACAAGATAADQNFAGVTCISFSPAGFCDGMEYDKAKKATWHNYDCAGSMGKQTKATYKKKAATTFCDGTKGCNPAAFDGWDSFTWKFNLKASTGTLTGMLDGTEYTLQQDIPVGITAGACAFNETKGGISSLSR
jgi:hypothetical protein